MKNYGFYTLLPLHLLLACQCKDIRKLPEKKLITFKATLVAPKEVPYLGENTTSPIKLRLTAEDEEAKNAQFKLIAWKVAGGQEGKLEVSTLKLGDNLLMYTAKQPGTHVLTIKVAIEGEEDSAQTFPCTIQIRDADYKIRGRADPTGRLTIQIEDAPQELRGEQWQITETAWSQGLQGNIAHDTPGLTHGDNHLQVDLQHIDLEEAPALHLTIKGPDQKEAPLIIDLTEACIEQLRVDLASRGTQAEQWSNNSQRTRAQEIDDSEAAKSDKCSKLQTLLAQLKIFQEQYQKNIERARKSLDLVDSDQLKIQLLDNEQYNEKLKEEIKALDINIYVLKKGSLGPEKLLFEALKHRDDQTINTCLNGNIDLRAVDDRRKTLLHQAVLSNNVEATRKLIEKQADVNAVATQGQTALCFAARGNNIEMVKLLYDAGGDLSIKSVDGISLVQFAATARSPEVLEFLIKKFREKRLDVGSSDLEGNTALHYLAKTCRKECSRMQDVQSWLATVEIQKKMLKLLLDCNEINPSQKDHRGRVAFRYAPGSLQEYWQSLYKR